MNTDEKLIASIKGFLDEEEGQGLYEYALRASGLGPCLEVGSYCGKSAFYLGSACRKSGNTLFSIDHHRGSEEQQPGEEYFDPDLFDEVDNKVNTFRLFRKTLEITNLEDTVVPIVCRSEVAARSWATPLGLMFIDGGHAFETAFLDYNCWSHHVVKGGFLLIHDLFEKPEDGGQAPFEVYQIAKNSSLFEELPRIKTLGVLRRK